MVDLIIIGHGLLAHLVQGLVVGVVGRDVMGCFLLVRNTVKSFLKTSLKVWSTCPAHRGRNDTFVMQVRSGHFE